MSGHSPRLLAIRRHSKLNISMAIRLSLLIAALLTFQQASSAQNYSVIESAGRSNANVNVRIRKLQVRGKVLLIVTALLATERIIDAKNKVKEVARQGSIIAGGLLGGGIAGVGVSFICSPAETICAAAVVLIGTNLGGMAAEFANDIYQDESEEFNRWMTKKLTIN